MPIDRVYGLVEGELAPLLNCIYTSHFCLSKNSFSKLVQKLTRMKKKPMLSKVSYDKYECFLVEDNFKEKA